MIVLDTHAWLWWAADRSKLSSRARQRIAREREAAISAISAWEIAMLVRKGRLELQGDTRTALATLLGIPNLRVVPVSADIAAEAGLLDGFHGDPGDRLIVATALSLRAALITKDVHIRSAKLVDVVW